MYMFHTTKQKICEVTLKVDKPTIILGNFNIPLSTIDKTTRQKISKVIGDLTGSI